MTGAVQWQPVSASCHLQQHVRHDRSVRFLLYWSMLSKWGLALTLENYAAAHVAGHMAEKCNTPKALVLIDVMLLIKRGERKLLQKLFFPMKFMIKLLKASEPKEQISWGVSGVSIFIYKWMDNMNVLHEVRITAENITEKLINWSTILTVKRILKLK